MARAWLAVLAVVALAVGVLNLQRPLANPDEGRYSEISREMVASGDWVTPRLDGIKYFEKPPLQYWASAVAFELFGPHEPAARLYGWIAGFATLVVLGFAAWRLAGPGVAGASVLALVASPYFMALGGIVTLDMGLTLWTSATFFALLLAEQARERPGVQRAWMIASWAAMALAVLSKGLIGIVFAGAAVFFAMVLARDVSILKRMRWGWGLAIFLAIAAPWFVLVSRANPEFAHFFFVHEHFERFLTHEHRRVQPAWFFIPIVLLGFLPWVASLPAAVWDAWKAQGAQRFDSRMALAWSAFILTFFSASGSKLPAYVLPLFPALAFALGRFLAAAPGARLARHALWTVAIALALAVAAAIAPISGDPWTRSLYAHAWPWLVAGIAAIGAGALAAALLARGERRFEALAAMALGSVVALGLLIEGYGALTPRQSGIDVARAMAPYLGSNPRLYSVEYYDQTIPFYLGRTVTLVSYVDEFETGLAAEPDKSIARLADFPAQWLRPGGALAIMQPRAYAQMKALGLPMIVLHVDPRRVVVRKP
ncbi:MAG TPA: glycosyltransferase family 39 protein [Usitatibacter sp.]|nr:glycosyltransferase family 39 protein [Usitatibacter sp.]